jgi:hypothetical protein
MVDQEQVERVAMAQVLIHLGYLLPVSDRIYLELIG